MQVIQTRPPTIAIDFDGTIVKAAYPQIGEFVPGALQWIDRYQTAGARLLLWTCRSGETLANAVAHLNKHKLHFWGVNENPDQHTWSASKKAFADVYIDDAAYGCPLIYPHPKGTKSSVPPYVDWNLVGPVVYQRYIENW